MRLYTGLALILVVVSQACSPAHSIQSKTLPASTTPLVTGNGTQPPAPSAVPSRTIPALDELLKQPGLQSAQVGVCLYDPSSSTYKVNYQGDKYFIPASNTKLFSLYAGMKYLGDSLVGMRYVETDTAIFILPSGDPTFLYPSFPDQPAIRFLQQTRQHLY